MNQTFTWEEPSALGSTYSILRTNKPITANQLNAINSLEGVRGTVATRYALPGCHLTRLYVDLGMGYEWPEVKAAIESIISGSEPELRGSGHTEESTDYGCGKDRSGPEPSDDDVLMEEWSKFSERFGGFCKRNKWKRIVLERRDELVRRGANQKNRSLSAVCDAVLSRAEWGYEEANRKSLMGAYFIPLSSRYTPGSAFEWARLQGWACAMHKKLAAIQKEFGID